MKKYILILAIGAIGVLSSSFTSAKEESVKEYPYLKITVSTTKAVISTSGVSFIKEVLVEQKVYSIQERDEFIKTVKAKYGMTSCEGCTQPRAKDETSGICEWYCCYYTGTNYHCIGYSADCCNLPQVPPLEC